MEETVKSFRLYNRSGNYSDLVSLHSVLSIYTVLSIMYHIYIPVQTKYINKLLFGFRN